MIEKTEAIVLRVAPFSKTSHVVTWLTPGRGRLATVVKGACRPKSPFLGQYDLFYTCELLFYSRERQGLHIARECCPLDARPGFRTNWKASAIASYICDLVSRVTPEGQAQPESYRLVQSALDFLGAGNAKLQLMFWFELRLAEAAGLTPRLATCAACGAGLPDRGAASFSARRGGILCAACAARGEAGAERVPPDVLAILRSWQNAESPRAAQNTKCTGKQLEEFKRLLEMFLNYHLDTLPQSRYTAIQTLMFRNPVLRTEGRPK